MRRDAELNPYAGPAVRRFWSEVELAGSFGSYVPTSLQGEAGTTPAWQEKACGVLHGATGGSVVGGCIASWTAARLVTVGHYEEVGSGVNIWIPPSYRMNYPLYYGISGGTMLLGVAGGFAMPQGEEGSGDAYGAPGGGWRTGLATVLSTIPGVALGALFAAWAYGTLYGREWDGYSVESESHWRAAPAIAAGACIAVEFAVLGYKWGRSWEQARAKRAAQAG